MKIAVLGATGRMGRQVVASILSAADLELVAAVTRSGSEHLGADAGSLAGVGAASVAVAPIGRGAFGDAEVVVDFSLPDGTLRALEHLAGTPLVTGVTGGGAELDRALERHARSAPVVAASNFSAGVAVLVELVARATSALPGFDVEIVEAHHRGKRDAPSGTARSLGAAAAGATPGIHSLRAGAIVGEHQVWIAGPGERLVLAHSAQSRDTFAHGALRAARWVVSRPAGRYGMSDVLALSSRA